MCFRLTPSRLRSPLLETAYTGDTLETDRQIVYAADYIGSANDLEQASDVFESAAGLEPQHPAALSQPIAPMYTGKTAGRTDVHR